MNHQDLTCPSGCVVRVEESAGGALALRLSGRLALEGLDGISAAIEQALKGRNPSSLAMDLGGVEYLDSGGALVLVQTENEAARRGIPFSYVNVGGETKRILSLIDREALRAAPRRSVKVDEPFFVHVGSASTALFDDFFYLMAFFGELISVTARAVARPRSVRWGDVLFYIRRVGAEGLPIVGLISMLIGLIMAFMSSLQLKQFGANIYVASLVGIAIVRELGPIMTAILVAGRSASAFAAEIGTMMVNDEVDALVTMGFDPVRFLALPKLLATIIVVPLLTIYADLFGILGGMIVGVLGLDLTPATYLQATQRSISVFYFVSSLIKSLFFAVIIAGIGCQRGFRVKRGVEEVGAATTSAVVASILMIVVVDSIFAVVLHYWK